MENTAPDTLLKIIGRLNAEMARLHEELYHERTDRIDAERKLHGMGWTKNYLKDDNPWEELA